MPNELNISQKKLFYILNVVAKLIYHLGETPQLLVLLLIVT